MLLDKKETIRSQKWKCRNPLLNKYTLSEKTPAHDSRYTHEWKKYFDIRDRDYRLFTDENVTTDVPLDVFPHAPYGGYGQMAKKHKVLHYSLVPGIPSTSNTYHAAKHSIETLLDSIIPDYADKIKIENTMGPIAQLICRRCPTAHFIAFKNP